MLVSAPPARLWAAPALLVAAALVPRTAGAQTTPPATPPPAPIVLPRPAEPITLDLGVRLGGAARVGDAPAFSITGRSGVVMGLGVAVAPSPRYAIGLAYEHADLGSEHGEGDLATVDLTRSLDGLWASIRLNLFQNDRVAIGLLLGPGLVWQHVTADVILYGGTAGRPDVYRCSESGTVGLGLRAGLGAEVQLGGGFVLGVDAVADELRLGSDALGTCAPGAGSTALIGGRANLAYRFDVSRYLR